MLRKLVWTPKRIAVLRHFAAQGLRPDQIARHISGVTAQQVEHKLSSFCLSEYARRRRAEEDARLAERDRVLSQPRTLTAELCGDPLPGRSALDRSQARAS